MFSETCFKETAVKYFCHVSWRSGTVQKYMFHCEWSVTRLQWRWWEY